MSEEHLRPRTFTPAAQQAWLPEKLWPPSLAHGCGARGFGPVFTDLVNCDRVVATCRCVRQHTKNGACAPAWY